MAHHKSAIKRIRQNEKRALRNRMQRTRIRNKIKKFREILASGDAAKAAETLPGISSDIAKMATKGIFKKQTASRRISRMAVAVRKLQSS